MKERKILEKHASKTTPQVKALERRLHFTVEGVQSWYLQISAHLVLTGMK